MQIKLVVIDTNVERDRAEAAEAELARLRAELERRGDEIDRNTSA